MFTIENFGEATATVPAVEKIFTDRASVDRIISAAGAMVTTDEIGSPVSIPISWHVEGTNGEAHISIAQRNGRKTNDLFFLRGVGIRAKDTKIELPVTSVAIMSLGMVVEIARVDDSINPGAFIEDLRASGDQTPELVAVVTKYDGYGEKSTRYVAFAGDSVLKQDEPINNPQLIAA